VQLTLEVIFMLRLHWGLLVACLPVGALCVALAGCGGGTTPAAGEDKRTDSSKESKPGETTKINWIPGGKGVITGKVTLKGNKPDVDKLNTELKAQIDMNTNKDFCLMGKGAEVEQQSWRINDKGEVENVVVWLMPTEKTTYFKIEDPEKYPREVAIDQPHCAFIPHCFVAFPKYHDPADAKGKLKPTGQKVIVHNSSTVSHNTKYRNDSETIPGDNPTLPPGGQHEVAGLIPSYQEPVRFECKIHGWMNAYLWSFDHPYAAVTKPDGTYKIEGVPTGVKMKIVAWHEKASWLNTKNGQDIEAKEGADTTKDFQLEAK
jgi:hypothetical protein